MPAPIHGTKTARADLAALWARDTGRYRAVADFLRLLGENPRPAGTTEVREGLLRMLGVGGCAVYWEDPAIRGKLTVGRVVDLTKPPPPAAAP